MKINIQAKIFSVFVVLIIAMTVVAFISAARTNSVGHEVEALSEIYIPLTELVEAGEVHALEQEVDLGHILLRYEIKPIRRDLIEKNRQSFEEHGALADKEYKQGLKIIEQALAYENPSINKTEMARIQVILENIQREHKELERHALDVIESLEQGQQQRAYIQEELLEKEEAEFDHHVDALRKELEVFTLRSARVVEEHEQTVIMLNILTSVLAALTALIAAYMLTRRLVQPIHKLIAGTRQLQDGDLNTEVHVKSGDELGELAQSFNTMVSEIRKKEEIKSTFGRYVDPRIVEGLINEAGQPLADAQKNLMTIFFSDIVGFTSISEQLTPASLVKLINAYLTEMSRSITDNHGVIDKYVGDAIMAFWGPPFTGEDVHAYAACAAALKQVADLKDFNKRIPELLGLRQSNFQLGMRIGINTGEVIVGNVGSDTARNFTVMGDAVNLASRLEGANKGYGTDIMVSESVVRLTQDRLEFRELDAIQVKGKEEAVKVYELLDHKENITTELRKARDVFEAALQAYKQADWSRARAAFQEAADLRDRDQAVQLFLKRIAYLEKNPPASDWSGVWKMTSK